MTVRFLTLAVVGSILSAQTIAQAPNGILITQRVMSGGPPITIQVQMQGTRMRTDIGGPNGAAQAMIFDGGKQVLYIVDPARKTYMEMTKADAERLGAQIQGAMAQMQAQLEKLPPAQRAQMEAMMKGRGGAAAVPQYTRTGSDKVGRWTCDTYSVTQDGQKIGEVCSVDPTTLGFGAADFAVMGQMAGFYSAMAPQMPGQLAGLTSIDQGGTSGFPVKTVMMIQGQTMTSEVIEASRQTFPDSLFAVPAGFAKQEMTGLMGGRGTIKN